MATAWIWGLGLTQARRGLGRESHTGWKPQPPFRCRTNSTVKEQEKGGIGSANR